MKIATKTLVTVFAITLITLSGPAVSASSGVTNTLDQRKTKRLERIYRHHDRKMELRASVLNISPDELRDTLKTQQFARVLKQHGFKEFSAYQTALLGKVKDELKNRGFNERKIEHYIQKRAERLANNH